jgi:hypothetical protein
MTRTNIVALLALVPALALGQGERPAAPAPEVAPVDLPPPDDAAPGGPAEGSATAADAGRGSVPPPDTYTVRPGDTLWDLSGRFLNNPWYWPKIWSYNPEITNPHWITPGNVLKFFPAAEEGPARVEPVAGAAGAVAEGPAAEEEDVGPAKELEDLTRADMKSPSPLEDADVVAVAGPYKIGFVPPRARYARHDTFVTPRELAESGTIRAAFEEKLMLSSPDKAYADFERSRDVKVGESYVIYKTERPIRHPVTRELFGYQSTILGSAKVTAVGQKGVTLLITQCFEPIERGALLGPWTQKFYRPVERRPVKQEVSGRIIGGQVDAVSQLGENHVVFLDRGERDGVEEGNVFRVLRSGDQYGLEPARPSWDTSLPVESVGDLLVVDVKERTSTALVTRSMKELFVGDRVEARPDGGSGRR